MKTDNNFVRSGRDRIADDNYQTVDPRCVQALVETFGDSILGEMTVVDSCSPQGSGILNWFSSTNIKTRECSDAFSKDYYCDWTIFNPPYTRGLVDRIIDSQIGALSEGRTRVGMAVLLRTGFDHAKTRTNLFRDNIAYAGQIKMLFRPLWFADTTITPIHNYVWHIWTSDNLGKPPRVWYW